MTLTPEQQAELAHLEAVFEEAGGRSIEVAERIDQLRALRDNIYDLIQQVRHHPDFVFGVIFTREDFPNGEVPEGFNASVEEDLLTQYGNEHIDWATS